MTPPTLQEISLELAKFEERIWDIECVDANNNTVEDVLKVLDVRVRLRKNLQITAYNLVRDYSDGVQRSRFLSRITYFIKFVYGTQELTEKLEKRRLSLRQLKPPALIFCALSHVQTDIKNSDDLYFETMIRDLDDFLHRRNITEYLFREDVRATVLSSRVTKKACFNDFKTCM